MIKGVILDLDGTIYCGSDPVPGAAEFISGLRASGILPLFVTNRANRTPLAIARQLRSLGIKCETAEIFTSAQATARYLGTGTASIIGENGLKQALAEQGIGINNANPDYMIVSYDRGFNYRKLEKACNIIMRGARFIATNPDKWLKMENGVIPGTGAIVAATTTGTGKVPLVIGKPGRLIADMAVRKLGLPRKTIIMVGDNIETDIPSGNRAGLRTALLLTGVSSRRDVATSTEKPTWVVKGFRELAAIVERDNRKS